AIQAILAQAAQTPEYQRLVEAIQAVAPYNSRLKTLYATNTPAATQEAAGLLRTQSELNQKAKELEKPFYLKIEQIAASTIGPLAGRIVYESEKLSRYSSQFEIVARKSFEEIVAETLSRILGSYVVDELADFQPGIPAEIARSNLRGQLSLASL